jgi:hypothetical protein
VANLRSSLSTALPYFLVVRPTAMPYMTPMQGVVLTKAFEAAAKDAGMSEEEVQAVVDIVAADPEIGAIMPRCGGARKLRVAKPGKGKSSGYRVIYYYGGADIPIFLLTVFGKNERANLSEKEKNGLAALTKRLRDTY